MFEIRNLALADNSNIFTCNFPREDFMWGGGEGNPIPGRTLHFFLHLFFDLFDLTSPG